MGEWQRAEWWCGVGMGETTMSLKDQGRVSFVFSVRERAMRGFPFKWKHD